MGNYAPPPRRRSIYTDYLEFFFMGDLFLPTFTYLINYLFTSVWIHGYFLYDTFTYLCFLDFSFWVNYIPQERVIQYSARKAKSGCQYSEVSVKIRAGFGALVFNMKISRIWPTTISGISQYRDPVLLSPENEPKLFCLV